MRFANNADQQAADKVSLCAAAEIFASGEYDIGNSMQAQTADRV